MHEINIDPVLYAKAKKLEHFKNQKEAKERKENEEKKKYIRTLLNINICPNCKTSGAIQHKERKWEGLDDHGIYHKYTCLQCNFKYEPTHA